MNPCELSMNITVIANALAENLSDDDLAITARSVYTAGRHPGHNRYQPCPLLQNQFVSPQLR